MKNSLEEILNAYKAGQITESEAVRLEEKRIENRMTSFTRFLVVNGKKLKVVKERDLDSTVEQVINEYEQNIKSGKLKTK